MFLNILFTVINAAVAAPDGSDTGLRPRASVLAIAGTDYIERAKDQLTALRDANRGALEGRQYTPSAIDKFLEARSHRDYIIRAIWLALCVSIDTAPDGGDIFCQINLMVGSLNIKGENQILKHFNKHLICLEDSG